MATHVRHDPPWRFDQGAVLVTGTDPVAGRFRGLTALTTCTLDSATATMDVAGNWSGVQVAAGVTIHALFTTIQLSSGSALAYR